jgi:hypothetical protein
MCAKRHLTPAFIPISRVLETFSRLRSLGYPSAAQKEMGRVECRVANPYPPPFPRHAEKGGRKTRDWSG